MSRPKDPKLEKERDYEKQSRALSGESRHAERKNRPQRRARAHRMERREVQQLLTAAGGEVGPEEAEALQDGVAAVRRPDFVIWQPATLGDAVRDRRHYRAAEAGRIYFRGPYVAAEHGQRFSRFLDSVLLGGVAPSRELAERFRDLLCGGTGSEFLHAFLEDQPSWRPKLEAWIAKTLAGG